MMAKTMLDVRMNVFALHTGQKL